MSAKTWDIVPWSQWMQTYYEYRDGRLYHCHNDNKDQHYDEIEINIDEFLRKYASSTEAPYPEVVAFLKAQRTSS